MRAVGKRQTIETLINEEALLLAKFLRDEKSEYNPVNIMSEIRDVHVI